MSTTIRDYFSIRLEEIISEFPGNTLIIFKGLGLEQIQQLIIHPNALLNDLSLLNEGSLDLNALGQSRTKKEQPKCRERGIIKR